MCNNWGQNVWIDKFKEKFPQYFDGDISVLEIGAADINGSIRRHFTVSKYIGLDVAPASCVDVVSIAHKYKTDEKYDVVCSTNALEHDMYWKKTIKKMYELTKPGGMMWFVACSGWEEHGTAHTSPEQSLTSLISDKWANYYKNIGVEDVASVLDLSLFKKCKLELNPFTDIDICFWGIKK